jgi:hypothetical protein
MVHIGNWKEFDSSTFLLEAGINKEKPALQGVFSLFSSSHMVPMVPGNPEHGLRVA